MRVSVVIPWHRNLDDLRQAVASVFEQTEQDFELVVVANGVSDGQFAAATSLSDDARFRVERLPNANASLARNHGLKVASGALIFFLDADDAFLSGKLAAFVAEHERHPFMVAFSRGERVRGEGVSWAMPSRLWFPDQPIAEFFFCAGNNISTSAIVVAAAAREKLRFNPAASPYEDPDLLIQAERLGLPIAMIPETLYRWNDERLGHRLSQSLDAAQRLSWIDSTPENVTPRARAAFQARCVAQHLFPRRPGFCLGIFRDALVRRAVPAGELALFVIRGLLPAPFSRRLVNLYLSRKSAVAQ